MNIKHSILIISYNQEDVISKAIESCITQTELPYEIVISDDCSKDKTFDIISKYQKKYPHLIKINRNSSNLGIQGNIEKILFLSTGNVVSFCGGDDTLKTDTIEKVNDAIISKGLNCDEDIFVLVSHSTLKFKDGYKQVRRNDDTGYSFFSAMIRKHYSFTKIGISRKVFDDAEYPSNLGLWSDWAWDVNMSLKVKKIFFIDNHFYNYNVGVGISSKTNDKELLKSYINVINYLLEKYKKEFDYRDKLFLFLEKSSCNYQLNNSYKNYFKFLGLFIININNIGTKAGIKTFLEKLLPSFLIKIIKKLKKRK